MKHSEPKFKLREFVFYMHNNKICKGQIKAVGIEEKDSKEVFLYAFKDKDYLIEQDDMYIYIGDLITRLETDFKKTRK